MMIEIQRLIESNQAGIRKLTGTVLIKELLDSPILYLSKFIIRNKSVYYKLLQEVTVKGNWEEKGFI